MHQEITHKIMAKNFELEATTSSAMQKTHFKHMQESQLKEKAQKEKKTASKLSRNEDKKC